MNPEELAQVGARVGCYEGCVGCSFGCLLLLGIPAALVATLIVLFA